MRAPNLIALASFGLLLTACAPLLSRVRVNGDYDDVSAITGEWNGEYHSAELRRSGSIVFRFASPDDLAFGDVVMVAGPRYHGMAPTDGSQSLAPALPTSQVLKFRFVNVVDGQVFGVLEPYTDPACGCVVRTTFSGRIDGPSTISGKFSTTNPLTASTRTGEWKVTKR